MFKLRRFFTRDPLWVIGAMWPLALLAPLAPGLPAPAVKGLPWRQEIVVAFLLVSTAALLLLKSRASTSRVFGLNRSDLLKLLPVTLFFLWSGASILWSASPFSAAHHTLTWGAYLLFFLMLCRAARSPRLLRASVKMLAVVVSVISVSSIIEFWGSSALLIRSSTGLSEPLAVAIPIFTALALTLRRRRAAVFCGATAVLAWLAVLQSLERAPGIGVCASLLVLAAASAIKRGWRPRSAARAVVLLLLFGAATALQTLPSPQTEDRPSFLTRIQTTKVSEDPNTRVRFLCWAVGLGMWRENPLTGVGAGNYDTAFPEARARFAAEHPDSKLVTLNEQTLVERAHNEYVQILAELGVVGFTLFMLFCVSLLLAAWRALRRASSPLALGSVCSLVVFALSSGASSVSFRWMGSGLVFFFAAALVYRFSGDRPREEAEAARPSPVFARGAAASALALSLLMLLGRGVQATGALLQGMAGSAEGRAESRQLFERSLAWSPLDASAHFNYGMWLYLGKRAHEAAPHLRYAVAHGYNSSVCYAYLAAAEAGSGDMQAAERTLAQAARVYPRSVFVRVRHAASLAEAGRMEEANAEYSEALALDSRAARGWRQLICFGRDAAKVASFYDKSIARSGELTPENCIFAVLDENERRKPSAVIEEQTPLSAAAR